MKTIILAFMLAVTGSIVSISAASAGNCDHSWDSAKDGSHCGGRAADQRNGGN
jgi:hypothetical protein